MDSPSSAAASQQRHQLAAALHLRIEPAAHREPALVLGDVDPGADGFGRVVLEQHADAGERRAS